jgi:predicted RNase H-like nuclease (RuvC/YqgF family)
VEQVIGAQAQITAQIVAAAVREAAQATAQAVRETATAAATVKENESNSALTAIEVLKTKMQSLDDQVKELKTNFKDIFAKLDEINKGRLPWVVTAIISILTMACGILATMAIYTKH